MNETLRDLLIKIGVDVKGVEKLQAVEVAMQAVTMATNVLAKAFEYLQRAAQYAFNNIKKAIDFGGTLDNMSASTGIAVENLQALVAVAEDGEVPIESLQSGLMKLRKSMSTALAAKGTGRDAFMALGVSMKDLEGTTENVLYKIMDNFSSFNQSAKENLSMELFGKSGTEMIPFLNNVSQSIKDAKDEYAKLGLTITSEVAGRMENFGDTIGGIIRLYDLLWFKIAEELMPTLETLAKDTIVWFGKNGKQVITELTTGFKTFIDVVTRFGSWIMSPDNAIVNGLKGIGYVIYAWVNIFDGLIDSVVWFGKNIIDFILNPMEKVKDIWNDIKGFFGVKNKEKENQEKVAADAEYAKMLDDYKKEDDKNLEEALKVLTEEPAKKLKSFKIKSTDTAGGGGGEGGNPLLDQVISFKINFIAYFEWMRATFSGGQNAFNVNTKTGASGSFQTSNNVSNNRSQNVVMNNTFNVTGNNANEVVNTLKGQLDGLTDKYYDVAEDVKKMKQDQDKEANRLTDKVRNMNNINTVVSD
jgi:hypothetical protein